MNRDSTEMLLNSYPILSSPVPSFLTVNSDTFRLPHQPHATYHLYKRSKLSSRRLLAFAHIAPSILARYLPSYLGTYCGLFIPPSPPDHQYSPTLTSHDFLLLTTFLFCLPSLLPLCIRHIGKSLCSTPFNRPMLARPTSFASTASNQTNK